MFFFLTSLLHVSVSKRRCLETPFMSVLLCTLHFLPVFFDGQGHHDGFAILVQRPCTSLELDTPRQAVSINVFMDCPYKVCSLIFSFSSITVERGNLFRHVQDFSSFVILLGDFNGRHHM